MPDNVFSKPGLAVDQLPSVTSDDDGKVLMVVNGVWAVAELPTPEPDEDEPSEPA